MNRRSFIVAASVLSASAIVSGAVKSDQKSTKEKTAPKPALIDQKECIHCGMCFKNCPVQAIGKEKINGIDVYTVDAKKCISCGVCIENCPQNAIAWAQSAPTDSVTSKKEGTGLPAGSTTVKKKPGLNK